jgi:adenosylcobinamide-GDP ribazoletransferase
VSRALAALASAFSYFSIFPVGTRASGPAPDAFALTFLPIVGAVVGALAGGAGLAVALAARGTSLGVELAFAVTFLALVVLTGAIHVDGFLDSCDALFAPATPQRRLEIMRDVRHGTFAVVGMAVLLWFWWVALHAQSPTSWRYPLAIAFACACARLSMIANAWIFPYARGGETTRQFSARPNAAVYAIAILGVLGMAFVLGPGAIVAVPAAIALGALLGWWMSTKLDGGLTGDCYGFGVSVMEVLLLVSTMR